MKCKECNENIILGKWGWYHITSSFTQPKYCNIFRTATATPLIEFKDYLKQINEMQEL